MKRLFLFLVFCALLAGAPFRAEAAPANLLGWLQHAASLIDARIAAIPSPAVTQEDRAARTAWKSAERVVDDALANPKPSRVVPLVASVDKTLVEALGKTSDVLQVLAALMDGLEVGTFEAVTAVRARVLDLPAGRTRNGLVARLDTALAKLVEAGGPVSRSKARSLILAALRIAAAAESDRRKEVNRLLSLTGLAAVAGGEPFTAKDLSDGFVTKQVHAGPLAIELEWTRTRGGVTHKVRFKVDPTHLPGDPPGGVPTRTLERRTYEIDGAFTTAFHVRTEDSIGQTTLAVTGSITIVTLDTKDPSAPTPDFGRAAVSGWFSFTGPDVSGPGTARRYTGRFNVPKHPKGPEVVTP